MSKIEIRGIIVPSDFDIGSLADYIEKGIITPESKVRAELKAADKNKPLQVYLNTPGGSVFAGNEIINAINMWATDNGQLVELTVGSLAASMGAAMVMTIPSRVSVHKNSKIMFHSAWGGIMGGAGAMRDEADLIDQINADVKAALLSRTSISPDLIATWFQEGREGWVSAETAVSSGIASLIIENKEAEKLEITPDVAEALQESGIKIAALKLEVVSEEHEDEDEEDNEDEEPQDAPEDEPEEPEEKPDEEPNEEPDENPDEEPEEDEPEDSLAQNSVVNMSQTLEKTVAENRKLQSANDKLRVELEQNKTELNEVIDTLNLRLEKMQDERKELSNRVARLSLQAAKPAESDTNTITWAGALKECGGDYAGAKKRYPEAWKAYFNESQKS